MTAQKEMPKYKAHKVVWAHKIYGFIYDADNKICAFVPAEPGYDNVEISRAYVGKNNPQVGGYYLRHEDGHNSYSPSEVFEKGNTFIDRDVLSKKLVKETIAETPLHTKLANAESDNAILKDTIKIYARTIKAYKRVARGQNNEYETKLCDRILKLEQQVVSLRIDKEEAVFALKCYVKAIATAKKAFGC